MFLSEDQLHELQDIINDAHSAFVANYVAPQSIPQDVLRQLQAAGVISPQASTIRDAYAYGVLATILRDRPNLANGTYQELVSAIRANPVPQSAVERQAVAVAQLSAGQYIQGIGVRMAQAVGSEVMQTDAEARADLQERVQRVVTAGIDSRASLQEVASNLGHETQDWTRDLRRVANTEVAMAMQQGVNDTIQKKYGKQARVAVRSAPSCCDRCLEMYGSNTRPKIFTLQELQDNGTNVGRKAVDALPVVPPNHPNCLVPDTSILTSQGYKRIDAVLPGDYVLTHKNRWRRVTHVWAGYHSGRYVKLSLDEKRSVTCTPNHPFLLQNGNWADATFLKQGMQLAYCSSTVKGSFFDDDAIHNPSKSVQECRFARVLFGFAPGQVPITAIDFNGNLFVHEGQIDYVVANAMSGSGNQPVFGQESVNHAFVGTFHDTRLACGDAGLKGISFLTAPDGSIRGQSAPLTFVKWHGGIRNQLGLTNVSLHYPTAAQRSDHDISRDTYGFSNIQDTTSVIDVHLDNLGIGHVGCRMLGQTYPVSDHHLAKLAVSKAEFASDLSHRKTAAVHSSDIVPIDDTRNLFCGSYDDTTRPEPVRNDVSAASHVFGYHFTRQLLTNVHVDDSGDVHIGASVGHHKPQKREPTDKPCFAPIAEKDEFVSHGLVYNLTVADDESFVANGIITHNCRCQLIYLPEGFAFNDKGQMVPESMARSQVHFEANLFRAPAWPAFYKAGKGDEVPGHTYIHRTGGPGHWHYEYTEPKHDDVDEQTVKREITRRALVDYQEDSDEINAFARGHTQNVQGYERIRLEHAVEHIDAAVHGAHFKHDIQVWKGSQDATIHSLKAGDIYTTPAFFSTSHDEDVAVNFSKYATEGRKHASVMCIRWPAGHPALDMQTHLPEIGRVKSEGEILLPRHIKLRVIDVSQHPRGPTLIIVEPIDA